MAKKFKILNLILLGYRKKYFVPFKDGLNYISGPTSTGKTSILEMINYCLGSNKHKEYIEIGESCTHVELEVLIKEKRYLIRRKLFDFNHPASIYIWDSKTERYSFFDRVVVDAPSNPKSLSAFLLEKLDLSNIMVSNQAFSFRDLFRYSYLKQTEIDNENIMGEKVWSTSIKRKPTFEIIFNIYDKLLAELKTSEKLKNEELKELEIKTKGIDEFLANTEVFNFKSYAEKREYIDKSLLDRQKQLLNIKKSNKTDDAVSLSLQRRIVNSKSNIEKYEKDIKDQYQYINKLTLLVNQYINEIDKIDFIIEGCHELDKLRFVVCPSCLQPIDEKDRLKECNLCGKDKSEIELEEIFALKSEKRLVKKRLNELLKFIKDEEINLQILQKEKHEENEDLKSFEKELLHLHKDYTDPFIEQVEQLNYEIGELNRCLRELENSHKMLIELERFNNLRASKQKSIEDLKDRIKNTEDTATCKEDVINDLSTLLEDILQGFKFPKLENVYIDGKTYLPYARGRLYRELGSLAGVTLITMAYYLAIAIKAREKEYNHLGLLIIDSPRKNLGADANEETFKDEEIFNSIIRYFIKVDEQYGEELQLIVVNNGYPTFVESKYIIKEFDGVGTKVLPYGLIDDVQD